MSQTVAVDHHWILTIQRPNGLISGRAGVAAVPDGMTRVEALQSICDTHFPGEQPVVVLFFSIEPNQL